MEKLLNVFEKFEPGGQTETGEMKIPHDGLVKKIKALISFLLSHHSAGMGVLLGNVAPPEALEVREMLALSRGFRDPGVRVMGGALPGSGIERVCAVAACVDRIVDAAGGWDHIVGCCRWCADAWREHWQMLEDYSVMVKPGGAVHDGSGGAVAKLAQKYGQVSERTLRRRRDRVIGQIAEYIISKPH